MAGSFVISGMSAGEASGQRVFGPLTIMGSAVIGETFTVALVSGDNTFAVPAGAVAALIVPPAGSTVALRVRTSLNSGDQGLPINAGAVPAVFAFPSVAPSSLIVNAGSGTAFGFTIAFI